MALVWAEPFDQYGGNNTFMLNAGYSDVNVNSWIAGRTGSKAAQLFGSIGMRRALDTPVTTLGMGCGFFPNGGIAGDNSNNMGLRFESAGKTTELRVCVLADNSLGVYDRTLALLGRTAPNTLIQNVWQWVEIKAIGNVGGVVGTGSVEVRINGISKLIVNGINLPNIFAFWGVIGTLGNLAVDDVIIWDASGPQNNDFMGDRRLFVSYPNANLALQDFVPSTGSAFDRINDSPPVDTSYIEGAAAGNISEFSKDLIGIQSTDIAAVVVCGRLFKTDAGVASGRVGFNSNGFVSNSPELFPGTSGGYFNFIIELDPNGNIHWTRAAVDAGALRVSRVQ